MPEGLQHTCCPGHRDLLGALLRSFWARAPGHGEAGVGRVRAVDGDVLFEQLKVICGGLDILSNQQLQTLRVSRLA